MRTIKYADVLKAMALKNELEKLQFAKHLAEEYDEFFIILTDSFGFAKATVQLLETALNGAKVQMDYDFLKVIKDIKKEKSIFEAALFTMVHFPNNEFTIAMKDLFEVPDVDVVGYANLLSELANAKNEGMKQEILEKKSQQRVEIFQPTLLIPRKEHGTKIPVIRVVDRNNEFVRYIEGKNQEDSEKVQKVEHSYRILESWPQSHRGILGGEIRRLKKDENIVIENQGANRKVTYLSH